MSATTTTTVWTIRELLSWTTKYLAEKGIESSRLEAQILLAHVLKCPRIELIARSNEEPAANEKAAFREMVKRRVDGWPVAYLTGSKEFYLLSFRVSPAVLIPRPDTETLVLEAINKIKQQQAADPARQIRILDLCTGSGCIAISIAVNCPTAKIIATDLSPDAVEVAKANAKTHQVSDRIQFLSGDLFTPIKNEPPFDFVLSNPPYIATIEIETLTTDVKDHEPRLALDGGPDGLAFYRRIAKEIPAFINPGGWLLLEVGETQASAVVSLFEELGRKCSTIKDLGKHHRVVAVSW